MSNVVCSCLSGDNARVRLRLSQLLHKDSAALYEEATEELIGDICEVELPGCIRDFFRNTTGVLLEVGQMVIVESDGGYDFGVVYAAGLIARKKYLIKGLDRKAEETPAVLRFVTEDDLMGIGEVKKKQDEIRDVCREKIKRHGIDLKLVDVELRLDRQKLSVYYTSLHRVDFRNLVRDLAGEFKARIQMVQITTREEARRANASGPCGCHICCSAWMQKIHANPFADKAQYLDTAGNENNAFNMTGLCNKTKCCLGFSGNGGGLPQIGSRLSTPDGPAVVHSVDGGRKSVTIRYEKNSRKRSLSLERFNTLVTRKK
jgi:cell fate regulator YaaT (PSP1 superfamily)